MKYISPITLDRMLAYPEISTGCGLCDAVAQELQDPTVKKSSVVAARMALPYTAVSGAIRAQMGMTLSQMLAAYRYARIKEYMVTHPRATTKEVASHFGFKCPKSLWSFLKSRKG